MSSAITYVIILIFILLTRLITLFIVSFLVEVPDVYERDVMLLDRYKLIIFDWDGTLSTSTPIVKVARFAKMRYKQRGHREEQGHLQGRRRYKDTEERRGDKQGIRVPL